MQMQCALVLFQDPELPAPLTRLSPWVDIQTETRESVFSVLEAQTHRRFIKTHTPLDGIPWDERVTYITVGRDPRDVALSWDNHMGNLNLESVLNQRIAVAGADDLEELLRPEMLAPPEDPVDRFWMWIEDDSIGDDDPSGGVFENALDAPAKWLSSRLRPTPPAPKVEPEKELTLT